MTLRHMKIFVSVYQNNSFTKAAEHLHLAQPSVSLAIKELESYYGILLFDRIAKHIYPTDSGKRLYNYALHIVSLFEEMENNIRNWEAESSLRIGSSITVGNFFLPHLIKSFKLSYPNINLSVVIRNSKNIEQFILDNEIDLALIEGELSNSHLIKKDFVKDRLCLIVNPDHPFTKKSAVELAELMRQDLLLREPGSAGREMIEGLFHAHELTIVPVWESTSTQALVRAVQEGLGISILPYLLVQDDIRHGLVREIPLKNIDLTQSFSIIYHPNKYLTTPAKAFLCLCENWVKS